MIGIPYKEYKYLYPPRPLNRISPDQLNKYDTDMYAGQIKYDGSCVCIFMNENGFIKIMNRHNQDITNPFLSEIDYHAMYRGGTGFMVLCGELLNKNKVGEHGIPFNKKFVIWDILCLNGIYLVGTTLEDRLALLEQLYPCHRAKINEAGKIEMYDHICNTDIKNVYKAPNYTGNFEALYNSVVKVQLYEGVILKRLDAKLNFGFSERNNYESILKCRKSTKNYDF